MFHSESSNGSGGLLEFILSLLAVAGGGWSIFAGIWGWIKSRKTSTWRQVIATITESRIRKKQNDESVIYEAVIKYRYQIDGIEHSCDKIRLITYHSSFKSTAERKVALYYAGREVFAYVNPDNASEAVLEPGSQPLAATFFILFGLIFLVCGIWTLTTEPR